MFLCAQVYQLPNGGFEQWDGTGTAEPTGWNSFATSECTLPIGCSSAQQTHHENSSDVRPGSTGSHSCRIYSTSIMGVVANGNMTTGRIHAGSVTAANSANYNVTYPSQAGFNQPFNGKPDYIRFWAKAHTASASTQARMNAIVHSNSAVRDPVISSDNQYIAGIATLNYTGDNTWHEYTVPFSYSYGNANAEYILLTFTTSMTPGGGNANDEVFIDDIDFIYISTLSDLKSNNLSVPNFSANTLNYSIELPYGSAMPTVTATPTSVNGVVSITQPTAANPVATIVVTQGPETTTYTISYSFAARESADLLDILLDNASISTYNVTPAFNVNTLTYNVQLPFGSTLPVVDGVLDVATAQMNITQPTTAVPTATLAVTCGSLAKTYTVNFTVAAENSANLVDLLLDGVTISGFTPEVTTYHQSLPFGASMPVITAVPENANAQVVITQPTTQNPVGTVDVTCGPLAQTYTVTFTTMDAVNAYLQELTVNGTLIPGFNSFVYDYDYELPFGSSLADVQVSATPLSPMATVEPIIVALNTSVTVHCGDSTHTYNIHFSFAAEITADLADLQVDGVTVNGFDPAITTYNVVAFGTEIPVVTATPRSEIGEVTITQATVENPVATILVGCQGLSKVYTVNVSLVEANADLADLQVNGNTINGFDPSTLEYTYGLLANDALPTISATPASEYASVSITQPTAENLTATIEVSCGPLSKTYTVTIGVGVQEFEAQRFVAYPNPTDDVVYLQCVAGNSALSQVRVHDVYGRTLSVIAVDGDVTAIDLSTFVPGVYVLRVWNDGKAGQTMKVVKR